MSVLKCNTGLNTVHAKIVTLDPGESSLVTFIVQSYRSEGQEYECEVELYDADYYLLQTGTVNFQTNSTCFCYGSCGCAVRAIPS